MDDNNELTIYVLQQLRYGVPEQAIRATLAQNGWPQPLIDRAFSMVQQAAPHTIPPADYGGQIQQSQPISPVAADLPAPAENSFPVVEERRQEEQKANRGRAVRTALIALVILLLLAAASFAGYLIYKAIGEHSDKSAPKTSQKTQADPDPIRKKNLEALSAKLQAYYTAQGTYPALADINNDAFVHSKNGFDIHKYQDPSWSAKQSQCVSDEGGAILTEARSAGCYSYRVTAMNGGDCDGSSKKCTRVVLTASLADNKPYIIALDQNVKE
jgi:hypothetical protein